MRSEIMISRNAKDMVEIVSANHLETLRRCGGYYQCPKTTDGKRLGPLVGYAGKYEASDGSSKQFVGDVYANFAKAEELLHVLYYFATQMGEKLRPVLKDIDVFCGAPLGGYSFATILGLVFDRRAIKAEKKVTALATKDVREQSEVVFARHEVRKGENIAIVEDVCNNFSTTDKLIALIEQLGGRVLTIVCLLNRSLTVDSEYKATGEEEIGIPVISLVRLPIPEYRQDDQKVRDDVLKGNVVWKPKDDWQHLMEAMNKAL